MKHGRKTKIQLNPLAYNLALIGEGGIGKTTIIKEYCEKLAGEDGYLFLEIGKEDGGDCINGLNHINCPDWDSDFRLIGDNEFAGFRTVIDDIVENRSADYPELKVVVIDTYDELFSIAEPEVIAMHNRTYPSEKAVKSIKAAFGGFQAGEDKAIEIVLDALWDLKSVGVSFIVIGHTKNKNVTDPVTGEDYLQLTTNLPTKYFNAIKTKVHFMGTAFIDRRIAREKTGKKDLKTQRDITKGVVKEQTRKISFRDNNFVIDSKSRFADITDENIDFTVDALIGAIQDAILKEHAKGGKSVEQSKAEQEKEEAEKLKLVAEQEKARKAEAELLSVVSEIKDLFKENKNNMEVLKPAVNKMRELGYGNPNDIDDISNAKLILAEIK